MSGEFSKSYLSPERSTALTTYVLDANASGTIQTINNIVNLTVVEGGGAI